jgi:putative transcriptional regulator
MSTKTREYVLAGAPVNDDEKRYHYTGCGLDRIYLFNGFIRHERDGEIGVAITDIDGLHAAIATTIVWNKSLLDGRELRFLRKLMGITQADLATWLRCDAQSVARWEKGENRINGAADGMVRLLYLGHSAGTVEALEVVKKLADIDEEVKRNQLFKETDGGWKVAA